MGHYKGTLMNSPTPGRSWKASVFLDSQWSTSEQGKSLVNDVQGFSRNMLGFNDVYSEHSEMQTSAKTCIQMLSRRTKEPQRISLPAGKLNKAVRPALDRQGAHSFLSGYLFQATVQRGRPSRSKRSG